MPRWNFATIRKSDTGGLGRLNITIAADASQQSLKIHIGKAQDIGAAPGAENGKGLHVECRVQIRPHDDDLAVFDVSSSSGTSARLSLHADRNPRGDLINFRFSLLIFFKNL